MSFWPIVSIFFFNVKDSINKIFSTQNDKDFSSLLKKRIITRIEGCTRNQVASKYLPIRSDDFPIDSRRIPEMYSSILKNIAESRIGICTRLAKKCIRFAVITGTKFLKALLKKYLYFLKKQVPVILHYVLAPVKALLCMHG